MSNWHGELPWLAGKAAAARSDPVIGKNSAARKQFIHPILERRQTITTVASGNVSSSNNTKRKATGATTTTAA